MSAQLHEDDVVGVYDVYSGQREWTARIDTAPTFVDDDTDDDYSAQSLVSANDYDQVYGISDVG